MKASDIMQAMLDAGAPIEAAMIALRALEAKDAEIEQRRAGDRERKRRQRAKPEDTAGTVTGQSRDIPVTVTDAPLPLPPNENISNPPTPTPGYNTPARKAGKTTIAKPDGVTAETWRDFTDHRKRKGGITQTALAGIEREAKAAGWPMEAALAEVVTRNWQGFKADWVKDIQKPNGQGSQTDPLMAGFLARQARNAEFADP